MLLKLLCNREVIKISTGRKRGYQKLWFTGNLKEGKNEAFSGEPGKMEYMQSLIKEIWEWANATIEGNGIWKSEGVVRGFKTAQYTDAYKLSEEVRQPFPFNTGLRFSRQMAAATIGPFQMLRSLCVIDTNCTVLRHFLLKLWRNEILR